MQKNEDFSSSDSEETIQPKTRYPLSRKQANQLFKRPVDRFNSSVYDIQDSIDQICKKIMEIKKYGYQFGWIYSEKRLQSGKSQRIMRRKVKLRFHCKNCKKMFDSIVGTYEIIFRIDGPKKFYKNNLFSENYSYSGKDDKVFFSAKIYGMKCVQCRRLCEGKIYDSQLEAITESFCVVLAQIFDNVLLIPHYDNRYKLNEDMHYHREDLCQACQKGVCFNMPREGFFRRKVGDLMCLLSKSTLLNYKKDEGSLLNKNKSSDRDSSEDSFQQKEKEYYQYKKNSLVYKIQQENNRLRSLEVQIQPIQTETQSIQIKASINSDITLNVSSTAHQNDLKGVQIQPLNEKKTKKRRKRKNKKYKPGNKVRIRAPTIIETTPPAIIKTTPPIIIKTTPPTIIKTTPPTIIETTPPTIIETTPPTIIETTPPTIIKTTPPTIIKTTPPTMTLATFTSTWTSTYMSLYMSRSMYLSASGAFNKSTSTLTFKNPLLIKQKPNQVVREQKTPQKKSWYEKIPFVSDLVNWQRS